MDTALIVRQRVSDLAHTSGLLEHAGYSVTATTAFGEARDALRRHQPRLLVTDVRLGQFNGLQLILWKHLNGDPLQSVLIDSARDIVIERDAERYGAVYLVNPDSAELESVLSRLTSHNPSPPAY